MPCWSDGSPGPDWNTAPAPSVTCVGAGRGESRNHNDSRPPSSTCAVPESGSAICSVSLNTPSR